MELRGSQTEKNLLAAFAGESQARNRYTYFSSQARKDEYDQISWIFDETANQEKEHAKRFFKFVEGGEVEIRCAFPAGIIGLTLDNLKAAAAGERHEHTSMAGLQDTDGKHEGHRRRVTQLGGRGGIASPFLHGQQTTDRPKPDHGRGDVVRLRPGDRAIPLRVHAGTRQSDRRQPTGRRETLRSASAS